MIKYCSELMAKALVKNQLINEEKEYGVYVYGFATLITSLMNIGAVSAIGFISGKGLQSLVFLITYSSIRQFAGGYHAKNHIRCLMTFMGLYLSTLLLINAVEFVNAKEIVVICLSLSLLIIYKFSPLEHSNNPLNELEKIRYKHITRGLSTSLGIIALISLFHPYLYEYSLYMIGSLIGIAIMLMMGIYERRRGKLKSTL
ncbi:MAG: agrB1 [Clostridia bacterium]|jgi:accessory gene regulator B|nr:agrB1 [Clostridia bacterium]